jgi:hypothetical protein
MTREEMIAAIDGEISRLGQIKTLLEKSHSERFTAPDAAPAASNGKPKRVMSPEARRRIALAQKRRWAKQEREASAPEAK